MRHFLDSSSRKGVWGADWGVRGDTFMVFSHFCLLVPRSLARGGCPFQNLSSSAIGARDIAFINSGKSPGTLHAESESLRASNREGVTLCSCSCSCGTKNDGLDGGTGHMCIRVGVIHAAHQTRGVACLVRGDGEGGGKEGRSEEHEDES